MPGPEPAPRTAKRYARYIGDVPGYFVFLDRTGPDWEAQTFRFSARSVATTRAVVATEVQAARGERVALRFDDIGLRRGVVERVLKEGFIVNLVDDGTTDASVDARIDWLNKKTRGGAADRRAHKRVVPRTASALLILGAENTVECRIKDMSASGAAIVAPARPPVGSLLAIGAVPARVVRHFEGGIAVRFLEIQKLAELEGLLTLRNKRQKALAAKKLGFAA
jgi:hypothetical protein